MRVGLARHLLGHRASSSDLVGDLLDLLEEGYRRECELVLFPELMNLSLLPTVPTPTPSLASEMNERLTRESVERLLFPMGELAAQRGIAVLAGSYWIGTGDYGSNIAFWLLPDGETVEIGKNFPTRAELAVGARGVKPARRVVEVNGIRFGTAICFDIEFPEVAAELIGEDLDVLICPSLTSDVNAATRVARCAAARAIEAQAYVLVVPHIGELENPPENPIRGVGATSAFSPVDRIFPTGDGILLQDNGPPGRLIVIELNLDQLRLSREKSEAPIRAIRDRLAAGFRN